MAEKGYVLEATQVSPWSAFTPDTEDNLDLVFPESVPVYRRMSRDETQVGSVLKAVKLPIRRTKWSLD